MIYRQRTPPFPLVQFVEKLWYYQSSTAPSHRLDRILPTGDMGIVINLSGEGFRVGEETFPGAVLSGVHPEYFSIDTAQQAYTLGVCFKPGGAFPFLKMPAGDLESTHVALRDVWGNVGEDMRQRLLEADSIDQRFRIVEETLLAQLGRDPHPAVAYALNHMNGSVADVTSQIGLSARRFTDVFRDEVGLTPKLFCRIRRFQQALRSLHAGLPVEWADFALANGYYDQPHFIHDFQAFSGVNPSSFVPRDALHRNHVALAG